MKNLKIEEYFAIGFKMAKKNYWIIFFRFIITVILVVIAAVTIIGLVFIPALLGGFYKFMLRAARGESKGIMDSWLYGFQNGMWWKSLLLMVISTLGTVAGFLLLLIPGIYLITAWLLAWFLLIDKGMFPTESLGKSRELVHAIGFWKVFGVYALLTVGIQILSVIPIVNILSLFILPFYLMIFVAVYENAIQNDSSHPNESLSSFKGGVSFSESKK
jgi:hypothetical protein|tara:strand:- start:231 stop:881 length:651 start_codon:yes stop_codon:yes gene_type:complete